jgi:hypothetical protein
MSNKDNNIIKTMPEGRILKHLSDKDQLRMRMLNTKEALSAAGYDISDYKSIQQAVIKLCPGLNTINNGQKLRANWYLLNGEEEYIGYFEKLVKESKEVVQS